MCRIFGSHVYTIRKRTDFCSNPIKEFLEEVWGWSKKKKSLKKTLKATKKLTPRIKRKKVDFVDSLIKFLRKNCQVQKAVQVVCITKILHYRIKIIKKFRRISNQYDWILFNDLWFVRWEHNFAACTLS